MVSVRQNKWGQLLAQENHDEKINLYHLRCEFLAQRIEAFDEARFPMGERVEREFAVVRSHAAVADAAKWQRINCERFVAYQH